jgi:SAM-dependent methyltransferase
LVTDPNEAQIAYWNAAQHWVTDQAGHDEMLGPLGAYAIDALALEAGECVLDIGCGTGATTAELARRVGPSGSVLGVDVSAPMLEAARRRGVASATFTQGDAQIYPFDAGSFDAAFSRFGVMFFADPLAAFANIRRALRPGGRLGFVCWRKAFEQEWVRVAVEAAQLPADGLDRLGAEPFSLADPERLRDLLSEAGYVRVVLRAVEHDVLVGGRGDVDTALGFIASSRIGRFIRDERGDEAFEAVREALLPRATPDGVALGAAVWLAIAHSEG